MRAGGECCTIVAMVGSARLTRSLRHRNYRLFFGGQSVSLVGTWITRVATSWLVYRLTGSELLLGVVGFCGQVPTLLLAPFAGVLVDRWDRHRILVITQALSLLQSLALAGLTLSGRITVSRENSRLQLLADADVGQAVQQPECLKQPDDEQQHDHDVQDAANLRVHGDEAVECPEQDAHEHNH